MTPLNLTFFSSSYCCFQMLSHFNFLPVPSLPLPPLVFLLFIVYFFIISLNFFRLSLLFIFYLLSKLHSFIFFFSPRFICNSSLFFLFFFFTSKPDISFPSYLFPLFHFTTIFFLSSFYTFLPFLSWFIVVPPTHTHTFFFIPPSYRLSSVNLFLTIYLSHSFLFRVHI